MHSIYYFADINECETEKHHCDSNAFCNNTKGFYNCTCNQDITKTALTAQVKYTRK